jgi:hypothetical protein
LCHNHVGYEGCDVQVRYNKPQSEYLEHILCNQHEYGTMNNLMTQLKPLNNLNMLTSTNNSTSKQFTRKGSLFQNNTQANRNLRYNWPFTPPPHSTYLTRPFVQLPSSWTLSLLSCTSLPDNQQQRYVPCFIFISITYLAPTQPRATH